MGKMMKIIAIAALGAMLALACAGCSTGQAKVPVTAKAEGWTDASTPVIIHVVSDDGKVDFCRAIDANKAGEIPLSDGKYEISFISPINADGSIYTVPSARSFTVSGGKAEGISVEFAPIEAKDVLPEQIEQVVKDIAVATAKGDKTLSGDAAKKILDKAAKNAAASGKVDEDAAAEAAEEASAAAAVEAQQVSGSGGGSSQGGSAAPSGGNGGGSSSGGSEPGPSQHEHTWVQQQVGTESVWIVDQSAWDEKVAVGSHIECTCGINWGTNIEAAVEHCAETGCTRTVVTDFDWVHHDEVGHYEDRAIYQTVCSECGAVA